MLSAQAQNKVVEITGKVIAQNSQKPIPFATVLNINKNSVSISDSLGFFHITMLEKEKLRVSAIGYETLTLGFEEINPNEINVYFIELIPKVYQLANIDIFDARWKDFEFEFKNVKIEEDETQKRIQQWFFSIISAKELALITSSTAIGIPIHFKTKKEKQLKKLKKIKEREYRSNIIGKKYNLSIVSQHTGLSKQEAEKFIKWCNFNSEFLYYSNDYDIVNAIKKRFKTYSKQQ